MKLMACNAREAYDIKCKRQYTRWLDILMDFKNGSDTCVQVIDYGNDARNCTFIINKCIRTNGLYELTAFSRGQSVFIAKKDYL